MGLSVHALPAAVGLGLMAKLAGAAKTGYDSGGWTAAGGAVITDIKDNALLYIGLPVLVGVGGAIVKGSGFNPGIRVGKVSFKLW